MKKNDNETLDLDGIVTESGILLSDIVAKNVTLLIFLRHLGCIFCREAMRDISSQWESIRKLGVELVFVHMESDEVATPMLSKFGLGKSLHISDPGQALYRQFGLARGSFTQLFGFRSMIRGFEAGVSLQQFGGAPFGDAFQMPGVFVLKDGRIMAEYIHKTVSDRPEYLKLLGDHVINEEKE